MPYKNDVGHNYNQTLMLNISCAHFNNTKLKTNKRGGVLCHCSFQQLEMYKYFFKYIFLEEIKSNTLFNIAQMTIQQSLENNTNIFFDCHGTTSKELVF